MYPLSVISIGCDEGSLPHVRRELMNADARLEAEFASVGAAMAALRLSLTEKRLLLVHLRSVAELKDLSRLSDTFTGWPILVLMDCSGEASPVLSSTFLSAMRAGASRIVPLPLNPADFKAALDRVETQFVYAARDANVIAVAGVTGGCGATSIAINLAHAFAQRRHLRCILVDLSLRMGLVASHLNIEPERTILDLLRDVSRVDTLLVKRTLVKVAENFEVLTGPDQVIAPVTATADDIMQVLGIVSQMADVVVLDVPCTYDDLYFEILGGAGQVVLVGEQKIPSIRAMKLIRETLGRGGVDRGEHLVINRFDPRIPGFGVNRLLGPLGASELVTIAEDRAAFLASVNRGCPLRLEAPNCRALADLDGLAEMLQAGTSNSSSRSQGPGLLGRLRRALAYS